MSLEPLIAFLQSLPPFLISLLTFFIAYTVLVLFAIIFGEKGIYCYIITALLMANIQVLKTSKFFFFQNPVALGTELFTTTYLGTDLLTEIYGHRSAQKAVFISFATLLIWALFALLTLGFTPASSPAAPAIQNSLEVVFLPVPRFFIASISAYLLSQSFDIGLFSLIKKISSKQLWIRNNVSTMLSALLDNTIFCLLAFRLLNPDPIPFPILISTYILGTYLFRVFAALIDTPVMYFLVKILKKPVHRSIAKVNSLDQASPHTQ